MSLKLDLKKKQQIFREKDLEVELKPPTPTNVKSISGHCTQFQLTFFLRQAIIVTEIFHKLLALSIRGCHRFNVP